MVRIMQVGDTYSAFLLGGDQLPTCKFDYKKTSTIRTKTSGVCLNEDVIQPPSQGKAIRPPQRDRVRRSEVYLHKGRKLVETTYRNRLANLRKTLTPSRLSMSLKSLKTTKNAGEETAPALRKEKPIVAESNRSGNSITPLFMADNQEAERTVSDDGPPEYKQDFETSYFSDDAGVQKEALLEVPSNLEEILRRRLSPENILAQVAKTAGSLNLAHCGCGDMYSGILVNSLQNLPSITRLNLSENRLTSKSLKMSSVGLPCWIVDIELANNRLGYASIRLWKQYFKNTRNITRLSIRNNRISDNRGAKMICAFESLPHLKYLNMSKNGLGNKSAVALSSLLSKSVCLQHLYLSWNYFHGSDSQVLANGLSSNMTLVSLDLSWNNLGGCFIGEEEVNEFYLLAHSIARHKSLTHLDISSNELSVDECNKLGSYLSQNRSIYGIHIDGNRGEIGHTGIIEGTEDILSIKNMDELDAEKRELMALRVFYKLYLLWMEKNISPNLLFQKMNDDGGDVDTEEFLVGLRDVCGIDLSSVERTAVFGMIDDDGSGEISASELSKAIRDAARIGRTRDLFEEEGESDNDLDITDLSYCHAPKGKTIKPNNKDIDTELTEKVNSSCWICGRWQEEKFVYKLNFPNEETAALPVYLLHSYDGFEQHKMIWDSHSNHFSLYIVVPPGYIRFYFIVDGKQRFSTDELSVALTIKGSIRDNPTVRKPNESLWAIAKRRVLKKRCNVRYVAERRGPLNVLYGFPRHDQTKKTKKKSWLMFCKKRLSFTLSSSNLKMLLKERREGFVEQVLAGIEDVDGNSIGASTGIQSILIDNFEKLRKIHQIYIINSRELESLKLHFENILKLVEDFSLKDALFREENSVFSELSWTRYKAFLLRMQNDPKTDYGMSMQTTFQFLLGFGKCGADIVQILQFLFNHNLTVIVEENYCPECFREKMFYREEYQKSLHPLLYRIRKVFKKNSLLERNDVSEKEIPPLILPMSTFLNMFCTESFDECDGLTKLSIRASFLGSIDELDTTMVCRECLYYDEFVEAICRVAYQLVRIFSQYYNDEINTNPANNVYWPIKHSSLSTETEILPGSKCSLLFPATTKKVDGNISKPQNFSLHIDAVKFIVDELENE